MSQENPTVQPEQVQTDMWAVFSKKSAHLKPHEDLVLIRLFEVPRYTQPHGDGEELSYGERLSLAVYRAFDNRQRVDVTDGEEFMVMTDPEEPQEFVSYHHDFDDEHIWDPTDSDHDK